MAQTYGDQAASTSEKFELYTISLVFTLLALSVQTAKFGDSYIADSSELLGWVTLLISGIFGLWRMELKPMALSNLERKHGVEKMLMDLEEERRKGVKQ